MSKRKAFSDQLREAIKLASVTRYRIAVDTGVSQAVLSRFMHYKVGLSMETVDVLVDYLGMQLVPEKPEQTKAKGR